MDSERLRDLERQVAYLVKRACERSGHDWGTWHTLGLPGGGWQEVRYCACCDKDDRQAERRNMKEVPK
jgi:hypothetical protein